MNNADRLSIDELHFSTLRNGIVDGFLGICVELGKTRTVAVTTLIQTINDFAKSCIIRILGDTQDNSNDALYALCASLRDQGYFISAELRANEKRPWVDAVRHKIALIDEHPWLMYAADEVRYAPSEGGAIPDPYLSPAHFTSYCYLVPHRDHGFEEIFDFLREHKGFRVLVGAPPNNKTYRKTITIRDD